VLELKPITAENFQVAIALELQPNQQAFVPSNLYSIAEAQFYPDACSRAIYAKGKMVGYVLYGKDSETGKWRLFRLMVDKVHQGKGYAKASLELIIKELLAKNAKELSLCYQINNVVAQTLYCKLGFREQGLDAKGRMTAKLILMNTHK
jgi:diamine N-acetyltransferase